MSLENARLILPCEEFLLSFLEFCREYKENNVNTYSLNDPDTFESWRKTYVEQCEKFRLGDNLPEKFVPATTFWMMESDEVVGYGSLRHRLNSNLERFGGHIGYAVKFSKWNKGYGSRLLELLLDEAAKLGIEQALVTCNQNNFSSAKVIEHNGGIYQDTIDNVIEGVALRTNRYLIKIKIK